MTMADTVAVMNAGRVEQLGPPAELYDLPATPFVATFLGQSNLLAGEITGRCADEITVAAHGARLTVPAARSRAAGDTTYLGVRPEKLHLAASPLHHRLRRRSPSPSKLGEDLRGDPAGRET